MTNIIENGNTDFPTDPGQSYAFAAAGTFGGGSLTLKWSIDGAIFTPFNDGIENVILTASGGREVIAPGRTIRATLSGASTPDINIAMAPSL